MNKKCKFEYHDCVRLDGIVEAKHSSLEIHGSEMVHPVPVGSAHMKWTHKADT